MAAANSISKRVEEFLLQFPPFDLGTQNEIQKLAEKIKIEYREAGERIFEENGPPLSHFFVVRQGSVKIFHDGKEETLVDICDEGDIFGVRPLLVNESYLASAETLEESLLYLLPVEIVKEILEKNSKISMFFSMGYASGKPMQRIHISGSQLRANQKESKDVNALPVLSESLLTQSKKNVLICSPEDSIKDAALKMKEHNVGSIFIASKEKKPLGIVTDKDLRTKVATGVTDINESISSIMSSPVYCIKEGLSVAECMIEMVENKVHHLCVSEDGTDNTAIIGIVSDHDLLLEQGFNPAILIKEMRKSASITALLHLRNKADQLLTKYIDQEVSMHYIRRMMASINQSLLHRIMDMKIADAGPPPCVFSWLALGSQGREEQLLRTDQDHALVFEDAPTDTENEKRKKYFLHLAEEVSLELERFGFERDPADIGAQNEKWCQPLSVWKNYFEKWVQKPDEHNILLSTIFFDFRAAYGKSNLAKEMAGFLLNELEKNQLFLPLLAKNAFANPAPLSFFRNFVVESSGEHKNEFDLKLRVMLPLTDASRVMVLDKKLSGINNTSERYRKLAEVDENNRELMLEAADSYAFLMTLRTRFGLQNNSDGRFINPDQLSKMERQRLRNIFSIIGDLQKTLRVRFQTDYLG